MSTFIQYICIEFKYKVQQIACKLHKPNFFIYWRNERKAYHKERL